MSASYLSNEPTRRGAMAPSGSVSLWTWLAFAAAAIAVAGSLFLSLGLGLKACPLCFYQRAFVMGAAAVLAVGLMVRVPRPGLLSLLALPLAAAGLGVAIFHMWLEYSGKLECPPGVLGLGTAPQQSLAILILLALLLGEDVLAHLQAPAGAAAAVVATVVLGGLLAWGCVASAPPPPQPTAPYTGTFDTCRVPYSPAR